MREHPILFSTPMVQAILAGRKTMTRRVVKPQPDSVRRSVFVKSGWETCHGYEIKCPYGRPGDRLWVKETFAQVNGIYLYKADEDSTPLRWRPSIHMPRVASRITLEVVSVGVERVQEITYDDCLCEGMWNYGTDVDTLAAFQELWQKLNAKRGYGWDANPWVWVVEFKRVEGGAE